MDKVFETKSGQTTSRPISQPFFGNQANAEQKNFFAPGMDTIIQRDTDDKNKAATPAKDVSAINQANPEELSELRKDLVKLFNDFDKQVVGDEKFDAIIDQDSWDDIKAKEATAKAAYKILKDKYDADMLTYDPKGGGKKPVRPIPVPVYTTCIDTQRILLQKALAAAGLNIKKVSSYNNAGVAKKDSKKTTSYAFATLGPQQAQELGAWTQGERNMDRSKRPKTGDIFVLAKRGEKTDKAATELEFIKRTAPANIEKKSTSNDLAQVAMEAAEQADKDAHEALEAISNADANPGAGELIKARGKVAAADASYKMAKKKADDAAAALQKAQGQIPQAQKKLDDLRGTADHTKFFDFSHVGFFENIESKNVDGTETWTTFDGGQTVQSRGAKQGAEKSRRFYDPVTNEISGEKSQGGDARWLQGWINVDKLAE